MKHLLFVVSLLSMIIMNFGLNLETVHEWKYVDYEWNSPQQKQEAIDSGDYNSSSCILHDVEKVPDGRLFVTSVREKGVPASVMTVTNEKGPGGPLLRPYPDWSWYKNDTDTNKCINSITSVYRTYMKDNYLFLLDCGQIGDEQVCDAQLLVFDLSTDKLFKRIIIPHGVAKNENDTGLLTTLTVFVPPCHDINDAIVLISDTLGNGLVECDMRTSNCCRIESDYMKPADVIFNLENQTFIVNDGILGQTLIHEKLYYAPLSGDKIYKMNIPKQLECWLNSSEVDNITELAGILSGQTGPIASHERVIFFSNIPETSILCADTSKEINSNNSVIIARDSERLQFPSGMKVAHKSHQLMILTNRYRNVITDTLDTNETNFRILSMNLEQIRNETNCFVFSNEEEKHKQYPPSKTRPPCEPGNGKPERPPKDHNGKPEGPPKNRNGKPEGPPKGHKDKPRIKPSKRRNLINFHNMDKLKEMLLKDDMDQSGNKDSKDHKNKPGDGPLKDNNKPGNGSPKDNNGKPEGPPKDHNGKPEGPPKDRNGKPKGHKGNPRDGPPKDHTDKPGDESPNNHTDNPEDGAPKDNTDKPGDESPNDHTNNPEDGVSIDNTNKPGDEFSNNYNYYLESHNNGKPEGPPKDRNGKPKGPPKGHKGNPRNGPPKDHTDKPGDESPNDHTNNPEDGASIDNMNKPGDEFSKNYNSYLESNHNGKPEGPPKDRNGKPKGPPKGHKGNPRDGPPKDHTDKPGDESPNNHTDNPEDGPPKDNTDKPGDESPNDHTNNPEDGASIDNTNKPGDEFSKNYNYYLESNHNGKPEGPPKDRNGKPKGPPKGHKGNPRDGPPKDHTDKPGDESPNNHTDNPEDGPPKDNTDKPGDESPNDHTNNPEDGALIDNTNKPGDEFSKNHNDYLESEFIKAYKHFKLNFHNIQ